MKDRQFDYYIRKFTYEFIDKVIELANFSFGKNYITKNKLNQLIEQKNVFYIAYQNDELLGYCIFLEEDIKELSEHVKLEIDELSKLHLDKKQLCYMKSMAVKKECRGTDLAKNLFDICYNEIVNQGFDFAIGTAWKINDKVPMSKIFEAQGFEVYKEMPLIWYNDKEYVCNVCNGRCQCSGLIYYKRLI